MSIVPSALAVTSATSQQQSSVSSSPASSSSLPIPSASQPATNSNASQEEKQSTQKPQQFSNLNVNDLLLNTSFNSGNNSSSHNSSNSNLTVNSNSLSIPGSALKSSSTESLAIKPTEQPPIQQTQQQTVNYDEFNIYMWSVCKICNKVCVFIHFWFAFFLNLDLNLFLFKLVLFKSTKKLPMSPDTWTFSFAKFLEITFYASNYSQFYNPDDPSSSTNSHSHCCKHSLFQDHYQYFRFKNIVTVFSTSKISIRTLYLPSFVLKSNVY